MRTPIAQRGDPFRRRRFRFAIPEGRRLVLGLVAVATALLYLIGLVAGEEEPERTVRAAAIVHVPPAIPTTVSRPAPTSIAAARLDVVLPSALSRAVAVADGASILVIGGRTNQKTALSQVLRFDPLTSTFTKVGSLPEPVAGAAAVRTDRGAVVIGGSDARAGAGVLAFADGKSTVIGQLPERRTDLQAAAIDSTLYVVGGFEGSYDPPNLLVSNDGGVTYRVFGSLLAGNRYGTLVAFEKMLYLIGGEENGKQVARILRIDPVDGSVAQIGTLPAPLSNATGFVVDGSILVAGGRLGANVTDQVMRIDPSSGVATLLGTLPEPLANASSAVLGDTAYLFGGEAVGASRSVVTVRTVR